MFELGAVVEATAAAFSWFSLLSCAMALIVNGTVFAFVVDLFVDEEEIGTVGAGSKDDGGWML